MSVAERAVRWARREPRLAITGAVAAALLLCVAGLATWNAREQGRLRGEADIANGQAQQEAQRATSEAANAINQKNRADQALIQVTDENERAEREKKRAEEKWTRAEWQVYANQIDAAQRAWDDNKAAAAWDYLNACRLDFRHFEHRYLYSLFTRNQTTLLGHTEPVSCVTFSPDGKRPALASWSTSPRTGVNCVAFSPGGKRLASGSMDRTLKRWPMKSGEKPL